MRQGDIDVARSLVQTGVDLNLADHKQKTLLHHLVSNRRFGNKELYMLQFFLFMGADADARDEQGRTPLVRACLHVCVCVCVCVCACVCVCVCVCGVAC